jgi:hypothetical protein
VTTRADALQKGLQLLEMDAITETEFSEIVTAEQRFHRVRYYKFRRFVIDSTLLFITAIAVVTAY